jgi:L-cysteate sulfo-lyase
MSLNNPSILRYPKYHLIDGITPIHELTQLNKTLDGVKIFVKRDDLMGIGMGGNKLRKLEYLIGDALKNEADYIITMGARQSNHARLTAAATAKAGLKCDLILTRTVPITTPDYADGGNIILDHIFGAHIFDLPAEANAAESAEKRMNELTVSGFNPYLIPTGGSSPTGCLGYAACAFEILRQSAGSGVRFDYIVVPNGSSGTHAGLIAGIKVTTNESIKVKSYNVLADPENVLDNTYKKACGTMALLDDTIQISPDEIDINNSYRGEGYGIPTSEMLEALRLLARTEGILLDPVYSGKAFAGLLGDIKSGLFRKGENVLFILTGGLPGLFAYRDLF